MTPNDEIQLWSASENGATHEAERLLAESATRGQAAMIDMGHGRLHWGWHPLLGRFVVGRKGDDAPAQLPPYLASLADAGHVHATGATPEAAVAALLELFQRTAATLQGEA